MGATSTRSRSSSLAIARASGNALMPSCTPSGSTSRTSRARMRSLIRCSVVVSATMRHHTSHLGSRSFRKPFVERGRPTGRARVTKPIDLTHCSRPVGVRVARWRPSSGRPRFQVLKVIIVPA